MNHSQHINLTIKRMVNLGGGGKMLPQEYKQVEYIERPNIGGNYDPYINTSVPLTNTYYLAVRYMLFSDRRYGLFGSLTTSYPIGAAQSDENGRMIISYNKNAYLPNIAGTLYTVEAYYDSNTLDYRAFVNGEEASYRRDSGNTANNGFCLFRSNWTRPDWSAYARIYFVKIKDSYNGNTTLDLVPCYRKSDNKPGMYDLISKTFFTNAGTGEFIIGPEV